MAFSTSNAHISNNCKASSLVTLVTSITPWAKSISSKYRLMQFLVGPFSTSYNCYLLQNNERKKKKNKIRKETRQ
eukprot:m.79223 g.79223  ORF g.79223 m.79223 type:complete len:75 (+) comp8596_c0_seq1:767-991(+)